MCGLADPSVGKLYLQRNLNVDGALFFIAIPSYEGEFSVGLGRICPDELDDSAGVHPHMRCVRTPDVCVHAPDVHPLRLTPPPTHTHTRSDGLHNTLNGSNASRRQN